LLSLFLVAPVAGCGERPAATTVPPPYDIVMNSRQLMEWVLEPAADVVWDSAGTIITAQGRQELAPTTDEGWENVVRAGAALSEAANLLMLPGRSAGDDWIEYSRALGGTGRLVMAAARAQDPDALFDAGGRVYQVCRACHNQYWVRGGE
jgi:hypothetical protein